MIQIPGTYGTFCKCNHNRSIFSDGESIERYWAGVRDAMPAGRADAYIVDRAEVESVASEAVEASLTYEGID